MDAHRKNPLTNIRAVTTNENHVALYGVERTKYLLNVCLELFCCQAENFTASNPDNCGIVRWSV